MSKTIIAALATFTAATMLSLFVTSAVAQMPAGNPVPVTVENFIRAETDTYFAGSVNWPACSSRKSLLKRMGLGRRAKTLDRCHRPADHRANLARAGMSRLAVDQHHAASALFEAAAVARALEAEMIAQHVE